MGNPLRIEGELFGLFEKSFCKLKFLKQIGGRLENYFAIHEASCREKVFLYSISLNKVISK